MQIETLGARNFAFGLKWVDDAASREAVLASAYGFDEERPATIFLSRAPGDGQAEAIGVGGLSEHVKGKIYSAAAAVAAMGKDGFFVLPLSDGEKLWFVGVRNGAVVSRTDVTTEAESQLAAVSRLAEASQLPVFLDDTLAGTPVAAGFRGFESMDIIGGIAHSSIKPMVPAEGKPLLAALVVSVVVLVVLGGFAFHFYNVSHTGQSTADAEAQRQQRMQTYITAVKKSIGEYPSDSVWAMKAMHEAERQLPPFLAGWSIVKVECQPNGCVAEYQHQGSDGYSVSPLIGLFGQTNVEMTQLGQRLTVTLPLSTQVASVDQHWLRGLQEPHTSFADWVGRVPETMLGGKVLTPKPSADLGKQFMGKQAGMPPLFMDQAVVGDNSYLDTATLAAIVNGGSAGGFRITQFAWSADPASPGWQVTWSRVHG